jgi:pimeloyl-ACP methyl ester carboxylesterase
MRQAIIIVGGYNSLWPRYLRLARDLEDLSGLQAVAVPLMPWHWWSAERDRNATNILQKLEKTVRWERHRLQAGHFILVGHSAGGLIARLYLHDQPVWGEVYAGVRCVSEVVTLGSPHCSIREPNSPQQAGTNWFLVDAANRLVPGTFHSNEVRYYSVAGQYVRGDAHGRFRERHAHRFYRLIGDGSGDVWGDGIVPVRCQQLVGAQRLLLEGVCHSPRIGRDWYGGSKAIIRRWWLHVADQVARDAH